MKICSACSFHNPEGVFYCEDCGQPLYGKFAVVSTRQMSTEELKVGEAGGKLTWGSSNFSNTSSIVVEIRGFDEPVTLKPEDEMIIGRKDDATSNYPALDLTPFGGVESGISRKHAAIRRNEESLILVDLGSVNGTYLNGQRLSANQPRILRSGDEVRLGKLVCHVLFK